MGLMDKMMERIMGKMGKEEKQNMIDFVLKMVATLVKLFSTLVVARVLTFIWMLRQPVLRVEFTASTYQRK